MRGLMRKELSLLTGGIGLLMAIASILFALSGGISPDASMMNAMAFIYIPLGSVSTMSMEERWDWDKMLLCSPVGRPRMVGAKYLTVFLQLLLNLVIFAAANLLANSGRGLILGVQQCGFGFVIAALMLSLSFWLGTENGRAATFILMIPFLLALGGNVWFLKGLAETALQMSWSMAALTLAGGLTLYGLSIPLAGWLYERRRK